MRTARTAPARLIGARFLRRSSAASRTTFATVAAAGTASFSTNRPKGFRVMNAGFWSPSGKMEI